MSDNEAVMGGKLITEQDMICNDCIWRGELADMPPSKCREYPALKPLKIISCTEGAVCKFKLTEEAFANETRDE